MEFLSWYYTKGINYYLDSWSGSINYQLHYFSLGLLLSTLFSPWKKLIEEDKSPGFNLQKKFEVFTFNLISRGIGAIVRMGLFWVGVVFVIGVALGGAIGFVFWLALPFFGYGIYEKYKNQPKNFVADLMFKLKQNPDKALEILLNNKAGDFVIAHVGITRELLMLNANLTNFDPAKLNPSNYSDIIIFLLESKVWIEKFLISNEIKAKDFFDAAGWWDEKQSEKTTYSKNEMGRPGIALELTFGYTPNLNKYSIDLSLQQPFSHRLIGRGPIVSRMERVLSSGNSVLLVGEPGVGKKTVVLEFAKRAAYGNLGKSMVYKRVLEFDYNSLLSESTDLNSKKNNLAYVLAEAAYAGNIILMIRDLHRLTNPEVEGYDFTDIFEKHLEERNLKIIAVTSNGEYERYLSRNLRLRKFFEKVDITPPSKEDAMLILIEAAKTWEKRTGFTIELPALRNILEESDNYVTEVPFPEKALELLDAVITYEQQNGGKIINVDDTNVVLAEKTGISFARLTQSDKSRLGNIEDLIHERLIGQNTAIDMIAKTLRAKTIGVVKEKRPLGSFLFLGPTGVGKTETAKVLSKVYFGSEDNILRFDMAEYSGSEGLERLIGSISKNQPGGLTTAIKNHPASLLLLDEIEKANKDIYNLFLALLDEGVMTDAFGKKIVCKNIFVVGTSNAGAEYIRQLVGSGVRGDELQKKVINNVLEKEIFSPEFVNRFDGVVVYEPLSEEDLVKIALLLLNDLRDNLKQKNIYLEVTDAACRKLASDGFDPAFGARPMRRIVNISIGNAISQGMIAGNITDGSKIELIPGKLRDEFIVKKLG
jgi:ATP-dependent Clp protease ATP-binding subunit ClpC